MSLIFRQRLLRFTIGFMVLNKFIEINTSIKKKLNFKCEVKNHKVRLQANCNIKFVHRLIAIIKYCIFCLKKKLILNIILIADAKH